MSYKYVNNTQVGCKSEEKDKLWDALDSLVTIGVIVYQCGFQWTHWKEKLRR